MPSATPKQHNFMAMAASSPAGAKKTGVPQSVGKEFLKADKGKSVAAKPSPDRMRAQAKALRSPKAKLAPDTDNDAE